MTYDEYYKLQVISNNLFLLRKNMRFRSFPIYTEIRAFIKEIYKLANSLPKQEQYELFHS